MRSERGQASVEWVGLLLLVSLAFAASVAFVPVMDGRPLGAAIVRALVCAVKGDCHVEHAALAHAYGERDAALVREHAPNIVYEPGALTLPIDYRRCRSHRCSDAPNDRGLDVSRAKRGGAPATAFTHVLHRGGKTYIQYWLYYPDSPSTFLHWHGILKTLGIKDPAFHPDDWEGYQVRVGRDGRTWVRATAHGGYQWCKWSVKSCRKWGPATGWTRVSRGSHAGHIPLKTVPHLKKWGVAIDYRPVRPGAGLHERSTTAPGLHLVPLETLDQKGYHPLKGGIAAPWTKKVYADPTDGSS
ncbi:MAG: hypothetical protein QOH13_1563 [Thermoleophilaceae bacterium]|nr:hypothetical protein [Thermoleophilaceae bacterium]